MSSKGGKSSRTSTSTQSAAAPATPATATVAAAAAAKVKVGITHAELVKHNGAGGSYWSAINGQVYDVSAFVPTHPGGDIIRLSAGRDASTLFECYHPAAKMKRVNGALNGYGKHLGPYLDAPVTKAGDDAFYHAVQSRVEEFLVNHGISRHHSELIGIGELAITVTLYLLATYFTAVHGSFIGSACLGIMTARLGFIMHCGNHMATSQYGWANKLAGYCMELAGSSHIVWSFEHQVAHHMDPNEVGKDNDCSIGAPVLKFHPDVKGKHWLTKYQHIITFIGMSTGFFKWYVVDFSNFWNGKVGSVRFHVDSGDWARLVFWKTFWVVTHAVSGCYYQGFARTALLITIALIIGAQYLENIFIVNHIQEALAYPPAGSHWAVKQVTATANWGSGSVFWNWFSGGLNHQIEHHLFPSVSIYNYPLIAPVVQRTCQDFGLPYVNYQSFPAAWLAMARYLRDLGGEGFQVAAKNLEATQPPTVQLPLKLKDRKRK